MKKSQDKNQRAVNITSSTSCTVYIKLSLCRKKRFNIFDHVQVVIVFIHSSKLLSTFGTSYIHTHPYTHTSLIPHFGTSYILTHTLIHYSSHISLS